MTAPFTALMGRLFSSLTTLGAELVSTAYSKRSIFMVPEGTMRFCAETALTTSTGESPLACSACRSRST